MSKTIIIGGVAGGATAAARLRRNDEFMDILVLEKGAYISYANCGLPYYIGDVITSRDALLLQTPEAMKAKFNINVRILSEVISIEKKEKKVTIKELETGRVYQETYDDLIIATGSSPIKPPIRGIDGPRIHTLWTVPDTDQIKEILEKEKPKSAAVIGGGFIGLEMAENLHKAGLQVSIIEMQKQVMDPIDYEMAGLLHENISQNNVTLILEDGVNYFEDLGNKTRVHLLSQKSVDVELVILSIGVKPNSQLAANAGLKVNERGGIVVNEFLETSKEHIFAVGDVIEVVNPILSSKTMIPLAGPANKQGRICADNICGDKKKYEGTLGTSVAQVFDLTVASVGVNEKTLRAIGMEKHKDYETILINQKSHAGYYPGATPLTLKLIFSKEGKIFGAAIVGQDGVDKRIDTIATTIKLKGDIYSLKELELAYAPPFSLAKDPVNMLGFVAENVLTKKVSFMEVSELDQLMKENQKGIIILDVTEEMERMVSSIEHSYHIPLGQLRDRMKELDKEKEIIVYCAIGVRAYNAARILMEHGFQRVKVLSGGITFYKSMHYKDYQVNEELMAAETKKQEVNEKLKEGIKEVKIVDCCGLQCPGPIMKVKEELEQLKEGEVLQVCATDMGFQRDVQAWCKNTGNTFIKAERSGKQNIVQIQKGSNSCSMLGHKSTVAEGKTMVVFSGDLDKVLASFIIANGAASMGKPVTMFFTFWGLNALRKEQKQKVVKGFMEHMFGTMMPRGPKKLKLSKMNMGGMGTAMMKKVMKDKNVNSLEELMKQAMDNGVKIIACTMSMDVMGIKKEELIDGVSFAGVASYLGEAEESNVNLFI